VGAMQRAPQATAPNRKSRERPRLPACARSGRFSSLVPCQPRGQTCASCRAAAGPQASPPVQGGQTCPWTRWRRQPAAWPT
jgi:hypothetical protein